MRILHVINTLDPNAGGPPAVALRLAAAQATLGHNAAIAAYHTPESQGRIEKSLASIPGMHRVEVHNLSAPRNAPERIFGRHAAAWLRDAVPRFDVLHLHSVWDTILRVAAAAAFERAVPYAVTPHGVLDPWCLGNTPAKRIKKHAALLVAYRTMLNRAAFLHTLNRDERDLLRPLRLSPPTEVIPNGVFLDEFANLPQRGSFASSHPELAGEPYILFLSRVHYKKGLDFLIEAFALLRRDRPELRLVVAGPDDGALRPALDQAARLGLADRVHAVGPLYARDKLAAFVDAQLFCLPSRQEGFSMAITEALACGLPAVISDQCHFPEVAEAGAGRVTPLDPAAIAVAMRDVLSDPARRDAMGRAGRALVEARYTWPRIGAACIDAYQRHAHPSPQLALIP